MDRRRFLYLSVAALGSMMVGSSAISAYARWIEPVWCRIRRITISLPGLPATLSGMRILHISDIHHSEVVSMSYIRRQITQVASEIFDLVVSTGDVITHNGLRYIDALQPVFSSLQARWGKIAVFGNHEYGIFNEEGRRGDRDHHQPVMQMMESAGFQVLRNRGITLPQASSAFRIIGLDDYWSGRIDIPQAFSTVQNSAFSLVLNHNPDAVPEILPHQPDLVLCGHTHGGQVCIPGYGPPIVPIRRTKLYGGLYQLEKSRIFVNRGLGNLEGIRFNCRPEIAVLTLV